MRPGGSVYPYSHTHTHNHRQVQCIFSTVPLQDRGFGGGDRREGKAAPGSRPKTFHTHLKSHRSPFSCRRSKNRGDRQAEQNEVKVIPFKRGDRYSHSVCMCTCVRVGAFYRTRQSAGKWSRGDMTVGQVSLSSDVCLGFRICVWMCVLVHANVYVTWSTILGLRGKWRWGVEKKFRCPEEQSKRDFLPHFEAR